jgi:cyclopropane fatty-acyl-phospholipid synthase-like methyltransferase
MASKYSETYAETTCQVCGSKNLKSFFKLSNVPILANVFWKSEKEAKNCPKGHIELVFCPVCGHIFNKAYDPSRVKYTENYENPLDFSPTFQKYAKWLAKQLISRYKLHGKDIISIGCGKGSFLRLLVELGNNRGVGFDPALPKQTETRNLGGRIKFVSDFYSQKYADYPSNLIVSRQALEHIHNPRDFLKMLRNTIGKRMETRVFFEVPNALYVFCQLSIWDIIYEHYSIFSPSSLRFLLSSCGFRVDDIKEVYSNQFLTLHASPNGFSIADLNSKQQKNLSRIADCTDSFAARYEQKIEALSSQLESDSSKRERVVIWGAGSKGVTFLNIFRDFEIEYAVDLNPNKQGMHVPGTGQRIVSPHFLTEYQPDIIIVMNPKYAREIRQLKQQLGIQAKLLIA